MHMIRHDHASVQPVLMKLEVKKLNPLHPSGIPQGQPPRLSGRGRSPSTVKAAQNLLDLPELGSRTIVSAPRFAGQPWRLSLGGSFPPIIFCDGCSCERRRTKD